MHPLLLPCSFSLSMANTLPKYHYPHSAFSHFIHNSISCLSFCPPALILADGELLPRKMGIRKPKTTFGNVLTSCCWVRCRFTKDANPPNVFMWLYMAKKKRRNSNSIATFYIQKFSCYIAFLLVVAESAISVLDLDPLPKHRQKGMHVIKHKFIPLTTASLFIYHSLYTIAEL